MLYVSHVVRMPRVRDPRLLRPRTRQPSTPKGFGRRTRANPELGALDLHTRTRPLSEPGQTAPDGSARCGHDRSGSPVPGLRTQAQFGAEALAEMPPAPAHVPSKRMDRDAAASPYQGVPGMATSGLGVQQRSDCAPRTRSSAANLDGQSGAPRTRHGQHGYRFSEADDQGHRTRRQALMGPAGQPILPIADVAIHVRRQRRRGSPEDHLDGAAARIHFLLCHSPSVGAPTD